MNKAIKHVLSFSLLSAFLALPLVAFGADVFGINYGAATGLGQEDPRETIATIIRVFMGFLGTVAIIIVLMGGFRWMTAGGNQDKVDEAKKLLMAGVIGLVIVLSAYAITSYVLNQLINATGVVAD